MPAALSTVAIAILRRRRTSIAFLAANHIAVGKPCRVAYSFTPTLALPQIGLKAQWSSKGKGERTCYRSGPIGFNDLRILQSATRHAGQDPEARYAFRLGAGFCNRGMCPRG